MSINDENKDKEEKKQKRKNFKKVFNATTTCNKMKRYHNNFLL